MAKVVAGVLAGSAAMLSEAAHSFADTTTEVLLLVPLHYLIGRGGTPGSGPRQMTRANRAKTCTAAS